MKRLLLAACLLALGATKSYAVSVTFDTGLTQLCVGASGCGVATQTIGGGSGVVVTFTPIGSNTVNANPSIVTSFGTIGVACAGGGTACGSQSLAGLNLYIVISQSAPSAGTGSISGGVVSGSISGTASSAPVTWLTPALVTIGGDVSYSIFDLNMALAPPSANGGITNVNGVVAVPLPASVWLLLSGLGALVLVARRRRESPLSGSSPA